MRRIGLALLAAAALAVPAVAWSDDDDSATRTWDVTITNLTRPGSQPLSPPLFVVHSKRADVWSLGDIATHPVAAIAEDANNGPAESASPPTISASLNAATRTIPAMTTVLVVDDEHTIREVVVRYLEREGYRTLEAADGNRARVLLEGDSPDLVVLDLMLPGTDGLELCRWIRSRSQLPVIMLTARGEESDRIVGLELGADDYVTKPFSPRELAARVRTVLRRAEPTVRENERLTFDGLVLNGQSREVTRDEDPVRLTAKEFDLLWFLASHPRRVFSRDDLMRRIWGYSAALDTGTLTVHVRRLREKLEDDPSRPRYLETVWGIGYRFSP